MTAQLDMFASAAPTFPPHLDPAKVFEVVCRKATDRDHVGAEAIGRCGNNRAVWLVLSLAEAGDVLACETFGDSALDGNAEDRADAYRENLLRRLAANQQQCFNL